MEKFTEREDFPPQLMDAWTRVGRSIEIYQDLRNEIEKRDVAIFAKPKGRLVLLLNKYDALPASNLWFIT